MICCYHNIICKSAHAFITFIAVRNFLHVKRRENGKYVGVSLCFEYIYAPKRLWNSSRECSRKVNLKQVQICIKIWQTNNDWFSVVKVRNRMLEVLEWSFKYWESLRSAFSTWKSISRAYSVFVKRIRALSLLVRGRPSEL